MQQADARRKRQIFERTRFQIGFHAIGLGRPGIEQDAVAVDVIAVELDVLHLPGETGQVEANAVVQQAGLDAAFI